MLEKEFFDTVTEMRRLQKLYFKSRDKHILLKAKEYEQKVDKEINSRLSPDERLIQQSLFQNKL